MADLEQNDVAIVPAPQSGLGEVMQGDMGRYNILLSEYSPSGVKSEFSIQLPQTKEWQERLLLAAILKKTSWDKYDIPTIFQGILYAERLSLDIIAGDVYSVQGRLALSNKAKIKMALATGMVEGIQKETVALDAPFKRSGYEGKDLECTVTIHVKGWKVPIVHKARLSQWYMERNPNWVSRPEYMLELNTTAHACELVAPGGTESDEAPPPEYTISAAYPGQLGQLGGAPMAESVYKQYNKGAKV